MRRKTKLPLLSVNKSANSAVNNRVKNAEPTGLDDARSRLGGRTKDEEPAPPGLGPGTVVSVIAKDATKHLAVVMFANSAEVHVLIDGTRLRRVPPASVEVNDGKTPNALAELAAEASLFARLVEGQAVRYADDTGGLLGGKLVEKCRYGALVVRDDGAVIAVGFRKLWPATTAGAA